MSYDQRPARVRVIGAQPPAAPAAAPAPPAAGEGGQLVQAGTAGVEVAAKPGAPLLAAALFVLGCAGGGFGVVALLRGWGAL